MVTYSRPIVLWEELVDISLDETGLSSAQFTDDQHFEEVFLHFFIVSFVAVFRRVVRILQWKPGIK